MAQADLPTPSQIDSLLEKIHSAAWELSQRVGPSIYDPRQRDDDCAHAQHELLLEAAERIRRLCTSLSAVQHADDLASALRIGRLDPQGNVVEPDGKEWVLHRLNEMMLRTSRAVGQEKYATETPDTDGARTRGSLCGEAAETIMQLTLGVRAALESRLQADPKRKARDRG